MDKRFFQFVLITVMIWSAYVLAKLTFMPPAPVPVVAEQKEGEGPAGDPKVPQEKEEPAEKPPGDSTDPSDPGDEVPPGDKPTTADPASEKEEPKAAAKREWLTLGSLDKTSPYRMLVTLDSRGAALERVELSNYFDIEDLSGYLGSLVLVATEGGCRMEAVGPGTPAANATPTSPGTVGGLKKDDILTRLDEQTIALPSDVTDFLSKTKPGQKVTLQVTRPVSGKATKLSFTAELTRRPVSIVQPETHLVDGEAVTDASSLLMTVDTIGRKSIDVNEKDLPGIRSPRRNNWELNEETQTADYIEFTFPISSSAATKLGASGELVLFKSYALVPLAEPTTTDEEKQAPAYQVKLTVGIKNKGDKPIDLAYRLEGLNGLPLEGWWYSVKLHPDMFAGAGARDIVYRSNGIRQMMGAPKIVSEGKTLLGEKKGAEPDARAELSLFKTTSAAPVEFIGIDTQFFAGVLIPEHAEGTPPPMFSRAIAFATHDVREIARRRERTVNSAFALSSEIQAVKPGGDLKQEFTVFLGPKDPSILPEYGLGNLVEYGWTYAAYPAYVLRAVLDFMYMICGNYGLAIVLLTVAVRVCMLPFSLKQARSAAKMQELAPEMQKIRDKYKEDMEGQGKAMQDLYKKHNFNPFGGCFLMFFQLPVFIGLYRCLAVDIDLRDASLLPFRGIQWASNLAGPDRLFDWKQYVWPVIGDEAEGWFGPYFNVLPFVTIVLFIMQQKLFTPPATDEQSKMQQKMMTYMTLFMGILFYRVPAGLCVYIITSSLWGIAERKLLPKPKPKDGDGGAEMLVAKPRPISPARKKRK